MGRGVDEYRKKKRKEREIRGFLRKGEVGKGGGSWQVFKYEKKKRKKAKKRNEREEEQVEVKKRRVKDR